MESAPPNDRARREALKRWIAILLFVTVAVVLSVAALTARRGTDRSRLEAGADRRFGVTRADVPAPPVTVMLPDGRPLALADLRGQVVFVNFWATWCPPCVEEMPSMLSLARDLAAAYPGRFRMVAISVDDGWDEIRQFFKGKLPEEATVAHDPDQAATRAYYCGARGRCPDSFKFPETYIIDPQGRLVAYVVGPRDWSDPAARRFLDRLLRG